MRRLEVDLGDLADRVQLGASIAINGTCLTVTFCQDGRVGFDIIHETLSLTNLGGLRPGDRVNVERSFRVGDEVGGHILSGHVSGVGVLDQLEADENLRNLWFSVPEKLCKYLMHKGFVAVDGASLTIAAVDRAACRLQVCLIPETLARTRFGFLEVGGQVNIEVDAQTQAIVDTVERVLVDPDWRQQLGGAI